MGMPFKKLLYYLTKLRNRIFFPLFILYVLFAAYIAYEISKQPEWKTYRDAFKNLLNKGATLVADRGDLHINQKNSTSPFQRMPSWYKIFLPSE
jgi:hypothetical protein